MRKGWIKWIDNTMQKVVRTMNWKISQFTKWLRLSTCLVSYLQRRLKVPERMNVWRNVVDMLCFLINRRNRLLTEVEDYKHVEFRLGKTDVRKTL